MNVGGSIPLDENQWRTRGKNKVSKAAKHRKSFFFLASMMRASLLYHSLPDNNGLKQRAKISLLSL
jgi:hypothetical protein